MELVLVLNSRALALDLAWVDSGLAMQAIFSKCSSRRWAVPGATMISEEEGSRSEGRQWEAYFPRWARCREECAAACLVEGCLEDLVGCLEACLVGLAECQDNEVEWLEKKNRAFI